MSPTPTEVHVGLSLKAFAGLLPDSIGVEERRDAVIKYTAACAKNARLCAGPRGRGDWIAIAQEYEKALSIFLAAWVQTGDRHQLRGPPAMESRPREDYCEVCFLVPEGLVPCVHCALWVCTYCSLAGIRVNREGKWIDETPPEYVVICVQCNPPGHGPKSRLRAPDPRPSFGIFYEPHRDMVTA